MRTLFSSLILLFAASFQVSDVMSFAIRRVARALEPRVLGHLSTASSTFRSMSAHDDSAEKTEEEKARIKAEREARK